MDPFTQGIFGAVIACSFARKKKLSFNKNNEIKLALTSGFIGGVSPDLDVFIKSDLDPLLFLEYHRQFTHSLIFAPFGGLIVAISLFILFRKKIMFGRIYIFSTLGFLSHGLLDLCTTYGTSTFWPFSEERLALNIISIIDPIFTIILFFFLFFCIFKESIFLARLGFFISLGYLFIGFIQHEKIEKYIQEVSNKRGHNIEKILLNPTFGNNFLWRTIYRYKGNYFVDAVYKPIFSKSVLKEGVTVKVIDAKSIFPELSPFSQQKKDIERFSHFSKGYIYLHPDYKNFIADLRYGTLPNDYRALWGIEIDIENKNKHVVFKNIRSFSKEDYKKFWNMLNGNLN